VALKASHFNKERDYWLSALSGDWDKTVIPYDYEDGAGGGENPAGCVVLTLDTQLQQRLIGMSNGSDLRLFIVLTACWMGLLHKYTGETSIMTGTTALKQENDTEFVNTVTVLKREVNGGGSIKELILGARKAVSEAIENINYPIEMLLYQLNLPMDEQEFPLFDSAILLENIHDPSYLKGIEPKILLAMRQEAGALKGELRFRREFYSEKTVRRLGSCLCNFMNEAVFDVERPLRDVAIVAEKERELLLGKWNDTARDFPLDDTLDAVFSRIVNDHPHRVAVVDSSLQLTYEELSHRADAVAVELRQLGVGPGSVAAVLVERSVEMIAAIFGVMTAGAAYVPVDPAYPRERVRYVLKDSGAKALVTLQGNESWEEEIRLVVLKDSSDATLPTDNQTGPPDPGDPAYVIYTSGSTGAPKGAIVRHKNALNLLRGLREIIYNRYQPHLNVALLAPYFFDASVQQIFATLLGGHTLCIVPEEWRGDGEKILHFYNQYGIEISDGTPIHIRLLVEAVGEETVSCPVRHYLIGGEPLPQKATSRFLKSFKGQAPIITNVYGLTECAVDNIAYDVTEDNVDDFDTIPIGCPLPNQTAYVLGVDNTLMPVGAAGELCVGGPSVGAGYLNRPDLTRDKFRCDPFRECGVLYRTGDLARYREDGVIELIGRRDFQVKIRGFRVELGEIEAQLLKHPDVTEAVVLAQMDETVQQLYLCAYCVAKTNPTNAGMKEFLAGQLPEAVIPNQYVWLEKMPVTPNGKVDRKALPQYETTVESGDYTAPRNQTEEAMAGIWASVLGMGETTVGIDDDFFDLGGHSLKAAILTSRIHQELDIKVALAEIFRSPTIRQLAESFDDNSGPRYNAVEAAEQRDYYPLTPSQVEIYLQQVMEPESTAYNLPLIGLLEGPLDVEKMQRVFQRIVERHEGFRTSFHLLDETPVQRVCPQVEFTVRTFEADEQTARQVIEDFLEAFSLDKPPLLRVGIVSLAPECHILVVDIHHIVFDGISMALLVDEFLYLYGGSDAAPPQIQFKDYAVWLNEPEQTEKLARQRDFWMERLDPQMAAMPLPYDFPPPQSPTFAGNNLHFSVDQTLTEAVKACAKESGATLFMILLAAYNVLLSKICRTEEVTVGIPIHGRGQVELKNVMGMFVNMLPLRNVSKASETFEEFLNLLKDRTIEAFDNQEYGFEDFPPHLFDTAFAFDNVEVLYGKISEEMIPGLTLKPYDYFNPTAKFHLVLFGLEAEGMLQFTFQYGTELFKEETVHRYIEYFKEILQIVAGDPVIPIGEISLSHDLLSAAADDVADMDFGF
jgi:amino acid adenylation domain-containing protein